jgi:phenylacetate 2-hydroxylase
MENLTEKDTRSKDLRQRRDTYLDLLLNKVREMIKNGTDIQCRRLKSRE